MEHNAHIRTVYAHKSHPLTHASTHTHTHTSSYPLYTPQVHTFCPALHRPLMSSRCEPLTITTCSSVAPFTHHLPLQPCTHTLSSTNMYSMYIHTYVDTSYIHDIFTRMPFPILSHTSTTGDSYTVHTLCTVKWVVNSLAEQK